MVEHVIIGVKEGNRGCFYFGSISVHILVWESHSCANCNLVLTQYDALTS